MIENKYLLLHGTKSSKSAVVEAWCNRPWDVGVNWIKEQAITQQLWAWDVGVSWIKEQAITQQLWAWDVGVSWIKEQAINQHL